VIAGGVAGEWRVDVVLNPLLRLHNGLRVITATEHRVRVRELRVARGWSQAHLAELSGLSVRTIQRIETGANPGLESLRGLAAVFGVDVSELQPRVGNQPTTMSMADAVIHCLRHYSDFEGVAGRPEFWWFALAVSLAATLANAVGPAFSVAVGVLFAVPLLAVGARRLRDAGESPWWMLILFAPVGGLVVVAVLAAMPSKDAPERLKLPT
jgi:transcriptional regulator with XRE-family HTH domain